MRFTAQDYAKIAILGEGAEDYLGISDFLWAVDQIFHVAAKDAKALALKLIKEYLESGLICVGEPTGRGPGFDTVEHNTSRSCSLDCQGMDDPRA